MAEAAVGEGMAVDCHCFSLRLPLPVLSGFFFFRFSHAHHDATFSTAAKVERVKVRHSLCQALVTRCLCRLRGQKSASASCCIYLVLPLPS